MKNNPFQSAKKRLEIVPVGSADSGVIYLAKRGGITPAENPIDVQEAMKRQTEATLIFLQAVKNCAAKDGISQADAREKIFPTTRADGSQVEGADLYDYLEPEQSARLIGLQEDARSIALQASTLFIQNRLAYPIILTADAKAKSNQIEIEPLRFQVAIGNKFRLGEIVVEVIEPAGYDDEILMVQPLPQALHAGDVGFLLDVTGREKIGDAEWTLQCTKQYLLEPQINAIYDFYQQEIGIPATNATEAEPGNSMKTLPDLPNSSTETRSTGAKSTGASKATESPTIDSTTKTLETSPIG